MLTLVRAATRTYDGSGLGIVDMHFSRSYLLDAFPPRQHKAYKKGTRRTVQDGTSCGNVGGEQVGARFVLLRDRQSPADLHMMAILTRVLRIKCVETTQHQIFKLANQQVSSSTLMAKHRYYSLGIFLLPEQPQSVSEASISNSGLGARSGQIL